jgi:hypothetical protein
MFSLILQKVQAVWAVLLANIMSLYYKTLGICNVQKMIRLHRR